MARKLRRAEWWSANVSAVFAVRHGLSIPVVSVSPLSDQVEQLALEIAAGSTSGVLLDHARRVAEAQIDLQRIRSARHEILAQIDDGGTLGPHLRRLTLFDRYERRARSRRKKSGRELVCATIIEGIL